jgi:hypothetical protein
VSKQGLVTNLSEAKLGLTDVMTERRQIDHEQLLQLSRTILLLAERQELLLDLSAVKEEDKKSSTSKDSAEHLEAQAIVCHASESFARRISSDCCSPCSSS